MKLMLVGSVGLAVAGCSSEVTRFSAPLFGGGGGSASATQYTGSVTPSPTAQVQSSPLDAPGGQQYGQSSYGQPSGGQQGSYQTAALPASSGGQYQGGYGNQPTAPQTKTVTVSGSDNIYSIARANNVPPATLMQANGISDPNALRPGQQLVIPSFSQSTGSWQSTQQQPRYGAAQQQSQQWSQPRQEPQPQRMASLPQPSQPAAPQPQPQLSSPVPQGGSYTVERGDTLYSIARAYSANPSDIASANGLSSPDNIRIGQRLTIPGDGATRNVASQSQPQSTQPAQQAQQSGQQQVASLPQPAQQPSTPEASETPKPVAYTPSSNDPAETDTRAGLPEPAALSAGAFRWPVRGRVISSFGDTADGGKNDGVNISVPEGTSVRAAENGVVAYAGSELKGFGNLILVRHADDWVSAYAHNSELNVKRGDTVTRGQVIAKAGQSGSVNSPQLHFELRKGSQPVDPLRHLSEN